MDEISAFSVSRSFFCRLIVMVAARSKRHTSHDVSASSRQVRRSGRDSKLSPKGLTFYSLLSKTNTTLRNMYDSKNEREKENI
jgi:hypothetical protein